MTSEQDGLARLERQKAQQRQREEASAEDIHLWLHNHLHWLQGFADCLGTPGGNSLNSRAADMRKLLKELQRRHNLYSPQEKEGDG